jgi:hypothetical protein
VDLDVRSRRSLGALLAAWPNADAPGYEGKAPRWLHLHDPTLFDREPNRSVRALLQRVARLPPAARRCWNEATSRTFDIGIQAGGGPHYYQKVHLTRQTVEAVARVGGRILVTVYDERLRETD